MRKSLLIIAFLFAPILVPRVRADSYSTPVGPLYYPDGATITSVTDDAFPVTQPGVWGLYYSFADGTGETFDPVVDGDVGYVFFASPVTSVTFGFTSDSGPFNVKFFDAVGGLLDGFVDARSSGSDTLTFSTDVTKIQWIAGNGAADIGGITSLSYTSAPEPNSLALLAIGLFGLVFFKLRSTSLLARQ